MDKSNAAQWDKYFLLPNRGLEAYFSRVRAGNSDEYRTTFAKGVALQDVLKSWKPTIDKLENTWPGLLKYENDLAKKVGPLSIMKPLAERIDDIDSYYDSILLESKPISDKAIKAVLSEWSSIGGLELRSQARTVELMKKSTNSGSPYFAKRRVVVDKSYPVELEIQDPDVAMWMLHDLWYATAVLGWRGQEGGPEDSDVKQRVVWMFPFSVNIRELQLYQPLIEAAQKKNLVPAWVGMAAVDQQITRLFDTKAKDDLIVCTDFTKFDQHFNYDMQECAKRILSSLVNARDRSWFEDCFPVKYMIPLAYDTGKIRKGAHGMASGSGGTNADETVTHRALQYEAAQSIGQRLNIFSQCLGDDGILSYPGCNAEQITKVYSSHGQEMNLDKQEESSEECTYLRRWHHIDYREKGVCVGVYSTYRAIGRLCEQERYYNPKVWGPKMVALRQLSIIENCKYHPLKEEFAQWCMKRDKYRLGIDIPGFLDDIEVIAKVATDYMPDFLGYTKSQQIEQSGIADWWIVKYLKSIA